MEEDLFCPRSTLPCGVQFLPLGFLPQLRHRSSLHHVFGSWIFRGLGQVPTPYVFLFRIALPYIAQYACTVIREKHALAPLYSGWSAVCRLMMLSILVHVIHMLVLQPELTITIQAPSGKKKSMLVAGGLQQVSRTCIQVQMLRRS